jgi:hypothetical protein
MTPPPGQALAVSGQGMGVSVAAGASSSGAGRTAEDSPSARGQVSRSWKLSA